MNNNHLIDTPKAMQHFHRCRSTSSPALLLFKTPPPFIKQQLLEQQHDQKLTKIELNSQSTTTPIAVTSPTYSTSTTQQLNALENWQILDEQDLPNATSQTIIMENVTLKDCLDIITDFEKYPEFLDGYFSANTVNCINSNKQQQNYDYTVSFKSSFMFSTIDYTIQVKVLNQEIVQFNSTQSKCFHHHSQYDCEQNQQDFFKKHHGQWQLKDLKNGNVQVTYFVIMECNPSSSYRYQQQEHQELFGMFQHGAKSRECTNHHRLKDWLSKKYVPNLLASFKKRIEEYGIRRKTQHGYNTTLKRHLSHQQLCL